MNSVAIVLLILTLAVGAFAAMLWSYYYDGTLFEGAFSAPPLIPVAPHGIDKGGLLGVVLDGFRMYTRSDYRAAAQQTVNNYEDKSRLELQFLDTSGCTSESRWRRRWPCAPGRPPCRRSSSSTAWRQRRPPPASESGERIMAASSPVIYQGDVVGVIRYVTSLSAIDRQFTFSMTVIAALVAEEVALRSRSSAVPS